MNYHYSDMQSTELLLEDLSGLVHFGAQQGGKKLTVDRDKGIIRGIKIIGFNSQNGRKYTPEALKEAIPLYEGIKVNIDHPEKGPTQQRSTHDRFGKFIGVRFVEGEGLFGDLLFLKNHPLAESVCEAAEREEMNDVFGMSHNAQGEGTVDKKGIFVVSKITEVRHVDLVADPATTKSLTESQQADQQETEEAAGNRVRYKSKRQAVGAKRKFVKAKSGSAKKPTGTLKESGETGDAPDVQVETDKKQLHMKVMNIIVKHDISDDKKADEVIQLLTKELQGAEMDAVESVVEEEKIVEEPQEESSVESETAVEESTCSGNVCEKCKAKIESKEEDSEDGEDDEMKEESGARKYAKPAKEEKEEDGEHEDEEDDKKLIKKEAKKAMKESTDPADQLAYYKTKDAIRTLCESSGITFEESLVEDLGGLSQEALERQIKRIAAANLAAKPKCSPTQATFQESKEGGKKFPEGDSLFRWLAN